MSVRISIAILPFVVAASAPATGAQQLSNDDSFNPRAIELFERDWALMHWAVKQHDHDGDGKISKLEADRAALAFKQIADGDGDGRVTPYEYQRAREFIIARY